MKIMLLVEQEDIRKPEERCVEVLGKYAHRKEVDVQGWDQSDRLC